jgi:hypothetical protein
MFFFFGYLDKYAIAIVHIFRPGSSLLGGQLWMSSRQDQLFRKKKNTEKRVVFRASDVSHDRTQSVQAYYTYQCITLSIGPPSIPSTTFTYLSRGAKEPHRMLF